MKSIILISMLSAISLPAFSQATKDTVLIHCEFGGTIPLKKIGITRIYFKDGSIRKDCTIVEFKGQWLIYIKDGSIHDVEISKISRILLANKIWAIYFDEKFKPLMKEM